MDGLDFSTSVLCGLVRGAVGRCDEIERDVEKNVWAGRENGLECADDADAEAGIWLRGAKKCRSGLRNK